MSDLIAPLPVLTGFTTSGQIDELTKALASAHKDFKPVIKDANNPFFKSKYADLAGVIDATGEALSKNGLALIQSPGRMIGGHLFLTSLLAHSSGQWIKDELELPISKFDAQGAGAAITYARRYAYQALVGVAAEDEDGNSDSGKFEKQPDGSFSKNPPTPPSPARTEAVQPAKPARKTAKSVPDAGKPWGGQFEPKTETTLGSPVVQEKAASVTNGQNIHGVNDIQDSEIPFPGDDKKPEPKPAPERLADEKERKGFMDRLILLKNKGYTGIREYLLKESGETITNNIPFVKMQALVTALEDAEKAGSLKGLLEAK
jgi:hypothetical protein